MTKLKYKDKDGFWQELPVGTNVVANPIIAGTESELTGLQVGDAKYKMPAGGKLYCHDVSLNDGQISDIYVYIINNTSDNITMDYIKRYLVQSKAVCFSGEGGFGVVSMRYDNGQGKYTIQGIIYNPIDTSYPVDLNVGDIFSISSQTLTEL